MSADDTIYVVKRIGGSTYTILHEQGSLEWGRRLLMTLERSKSFPDRGQALCHAHDMARDLHPEYGVREVDEPEDW